MSAPGVAGGRLPRLMVPRSQFDEELSVRIAKGQDLRGQGFIYGEAQLVDRIREFKTWDEYNEALIARSFDTMRPAESYSAEPLQESKAYESISSKWDLLRERIDDKVRKLESMKERLPLFAEHVDVVSPVGDPPAGPEVLGEEVFIVHGHNEEVKATVARFLTRLLGREPVVLHEQADLGRTIIEKFEAHAATAGAAVILLTGDDLGGVKGGDSRPRARQNVVLELGFFLGALGRGRVVILHERNVELPSDLSGVLYVALDSAGAWKQSVARELQAAKLEVDLTALLR